jgi:zinc protease
MNRRNLLLPFLLLGALASVSVAGEPELVTRVDLETGIGETILGNGLNVLTLERHSAPVVSVQIWYRVGSADERSGETGIAHFLEHMMFKGTDRYGRGEIDRITLKLGGSNNAGTSRDYTYFYFDFASDRWETALEIEANRMRNLALDPEQFAAEKKVVIEELQMGRDSPWGEIDETQEATAFLSHPYRNPIIGWRPDVEALTREKMKAFYDLHYHPRNATLVLVGDFDTRKALSRVQELFGSIPAGPERERRWSAELPQRGERRLEIVRDAEVGRVQILWHGAALSAPDAAVLEVVSQILGGRKSSRLNQRLVEVERVATSVSVSNDSRRDPGLFWIWSEAKLGVDPEKVLALILEEVARLRTEDVPAEELERAKTSILTDYVFRLATAELAAEQIGWMAVTADWRLFGRHEKRLAAVTVEDVRRVAEKYLSTERRTIAVQPPGGKGGGGERAATGYRKSRRMREDAPAPASRPVSVRLSPTEVRLENGLTLLLLRHQAAPVTAVRIHVDAGILRETMPGLARLTGRYLLEGAGGRDGIALSKELERIGAAASASSTGLTARCLARHTEDLVRILSDVLLRPDFPEGELEKLREAAVSGIRTMRDDPQTLASQEFEKLVFGDHPRGRPDLGTEESVSEITREDVLAHYRRRYVPPETTIAVVSDLPVEEVERILTDAFEDWEGEAPEDPVLPAVPEPAARRHHVRREIDQANVYLGHLGIARNDPDYYPLLVMDYVLGLGPGFTDRLSRNIRDRDGLAYDVYATISREAGLTRGSFYAYVGTTSAQREQAIEAITREIRRIREAEVSAEELADAKAYLTGSFVFGYETAEQVAGNLVTLRVYGLGFDHPARYAERVNAVTAADVLRVARKHLHPDRLTIVTVGPGEG